MFSVSGNELWKSIYGVSNTGQKRGRGKGKGPKQAKNSDLNFGQRIGIGLEIFLTSLP